MFSEDGEEETTVISFVLLTRGKPRGGGGGGESKREGGGGMREREGRGESRSVLALRLCKFVYTGITTQRESASTRAGLGDKCKM